MVLIVLPITVLSVVNPLRCTASSPVFSIFRSATVTWSEPVTITAFAVLRTVIPATTTCEDEWILSPTPAEGLPSSNTTSREPQIQIGCSSVPCTVTVVPQYLPAESQMVVPGPASANAATSSLRLAT